MMASYTLPLVGLIFISIAIFHIVTMLRDASKTNGDASISNKVRIKLAVIFIIVGMALFGFYTYIR